MKLVILFGRPGVGKYTIGKELSRKLGFRFFHNHLTVNLLCALFPFGSEPFRELREEFWLRALSEAAEHSEGGVVFTFVPEETVSDHFFPALLSRLAHLGAEVRFVQIMCEREEHARRMMCEEREALGKLSSMDEYLQCEAEGFYDAPQMPAPHLIMDVTGLPPDRAAAEIVRHLFQSGSPG